MRRLAEAVARTQMRRLSAMISRSPWLVGIAAALWLAAPVAAWRVGSAVGDVLGDGAGTLPVYRALVLGFAVTAAAAGAAVAAASPVRLSLGAEIAATPVTAGAMVAALVAPTAAGACVLAGPTLVTLAIALAAATPGGVAAALPLTLLFGASGAVGAVAMEAVAGMTPGSGARRLVTGLLAIAAGGAAIEGSARALSGGASAIAAAAAACVTTTVAASVAWILLAAARREKLVVARSHSIVRGGRGPFVACACAAFALLVRAADLRAAAVTAASFGVLGLLIGWAAGASAAACLLLGGGATSVAVALVPLSVRGRIEPAAWVWRAATGMVVAGGWAAASLAVVLLTLLPVHVLAAARPYETAVAAAQVLAVASACWTAALAAGTLAPRRSQGAGDDALSLGAFTVAAVGLGSVVAVAGPGLGRVGVPAAVAALLVLLSAAGAAVLALAAAWSRP